VGIDDDTRDAIQWASVIPATLSMLGITKASRELEAAADVLNAIPTTEIAKIISRLRRDVYMIETGTAKIGGVEVEVKPRKRSNTKG
jgi:hypothetical protein